MHPTDPFMLYNVLVGSLSVVGFLYLLTRSRYAAYQRFLTLLVAGLGLFVVGGPIVDLLAPSWSHLVHGTAAGFVILGLYEPIHHDLRHEQWAKLMLRDPTQIRDDASWMVPMDDDILELFHSSDLVLTPAIIAHNTGYSREQVNRRLGELHDARFVERVERGKYRITEVGDAYLAGGYAESEENRMTEGLPH
jgi:CRP-like cAMP-binding protein